MPSKVLFVGKKTRRPFGHLRVESVIVGRSKRVKNHHFFFAQTKYIYFNNYRSSVNTTPLATSTSVNKCYLLEQKKVFTEEKGLFPTGLVQLLVWDTNVAAVSLSWDTKNSGRKVK